MIVLAEKKRPNNVTLVGQSVRVKSVRISHNSTERQNVFNDQGSACSWLAAGLPGRFSVKLVYKLTLSEEDSNYKRMKSLLLQIYLVVSRNCLERSISCQIFLSKML